MIMVRTSVPPQTHPSFDAQPLPSLFNPISAMPHPRMGPLSFLRHLAQLISPSSSPMY